MKTTHHDILPFVVGYLYIHNYDSGNRGFIH